MNIQWLKICLFLAIFLSARINTLAQGNFKNDNNFIFILISSADQNEAPVLTDADFFKYAESVTFQVNKATIPENDAFINTWKSEILPYINRRHLQLRKLYVRGSASPEGPYSNNLKLGAGRAETLMNLIKEGLEHQYKDIDTDVINITEDYGFLCILMEEAQDPDAQLVRGIYKKANGDERVIKQELMSFDSGRLWSRLLKLYFPKLRAAHIIVWCTEPDDDHKPLPNFDASAIDPLGASTAEDKLAKRMQLDTVLRRKPLIALRTNLIHDFFYMPGFGFAPSPNIQLEFFPKNGHWTYNLGMTWGTVRKWESQQFWQVRDFQFETRRYFKGQAQYKGLYLSAYAHVNKYGIGLNGQKGWQGEGAGAGLSLGYVLPLTRKGHLKMEFSIAAGYYFSIFDPYVYGNPVTGTIDGYYYYNYLGNADSFRKRNHMLNWFGPTNLGISLTYDIIYRRRYKE